MIIHDVIQGTDEWHALRGNYRPASEAPAMMGASKQTMRNELLNAKKLGLDKDVHWWVQKYLFDRGHEVEALARVIVEEMLGEDLFPVVGTEGELLASLDGIDMMETTIFEHKLWNEDLAAAVRAKELDPHYYWQLEQQLLVSGAERAIFVTSDGTKNKFEWVEYRPVPGRAEQLIAGWRQFDEDLLTFDPAVMVAAPAVIGQAPENLPALHIEVSGMVTSSNLKAFKDHALAVFQGINRDLVTDQDFANAETTVKWCKGVEDKLEAAKQHALSQTASIDELFSAIDAMKDSARATRLELDRLVAARKEARRIEIKNGAEKALIDHINAINQRLGKVQIPSVSGNFAGVMKGKRNLTSMQNAVDTELARLKIETNATAEAIEVNLSTLRELAANHVHLFRDAQQLVLKPKDDVVELVKARINEYETAEAKRKEDERAKIREEEAEKLRQEQQAQVQPANEPGTEPNAQVEIALQPQRTTTEAPRAAGGGQSAARSSQPAAPTVTIPLSEYEALLEDSSFLKALQAIGVDNWSGYDEARAYAAQQAA